jgi:hypothetical protein
MSIQIPLQTIQTFFDVFQGIGVGKAQESFAAAAEIDAGSDTHFRLFGNPESFFLWRSVAFCVLRFFQLFS